MKRLREWFWWWRFRRAAMRFAEAHASYKALEEGASGWAGASDCMSACDLMKIIAMGDMRLAQAKALEEP